MINEIEGITFSPELEKRIKEMPVDIVDREGKFPKVVIVSQMRRHYEGYVKDKKEWEAKARDTTVSILSGIYSNPMSTYICYEYKQNNRKLTLSLSIYQDEQQYNLRSREIVQQYDLSKRWMVKRNS
ncbi:MAG: hypothetical protein AABW65_00635 [Nanoarchaeota archaeon]